MMVLKDLKRAVFAGADNIIERETELCQLDSFVGDGDHGVTVRKGYQKVKSAIEEDNPQTMSDLMLSAGMGLADTAGGAIGPILASMFLGFSAAIVGKDELGVKDLAEMFGTGLARVQELGGAQPGDCTMVDTLYPFVESLKSATTEDVKEALEEAAEKGFEGSEATRDMIPKLGRARNLAERAIGYIDAGSRSMYYFLKGFADASEE
jgi:dihydroxyacetone kinase phosphoprotein-dependent L subunit